VATFTINFDPTPFPEGTVVEVYERDPLATTQLVGAPPGPVVATATIANSACTFTGLTRGVHYWAAADTPGGWQYERFQVSPFPDNSLNALLDVSANDVVSGNQLVWDGDMWIPRSPEVVNVRNYGATGDGIADDTAAIQSLIDAAASGGTVLLPVGTYKITAPLTLGDNITLEGEGRDSIIKPVFSPVVNRAIQNDHVNGNENITLRNFALDRTGPGVEHGIMLNGVTNLLIDGVHVFGEPTVPSISGAILISSTITSTLAQIKSTGVRVVNCHITECGNYGIQCGHVENVVIAGNYIQGYRELIGIEPENDYPSGAPVVTSARNISITGNVLKGSSLINGSATGMLVVTEISGGLVAGVTVSGNAIYGPATPAGSVATLAISGIYVSGTAGTVVADNLVTGTDGAGIHLGALGTTVASAVVVGNAVIDCAKQAAVGGDPVTNPGLKLRNAEGCIVSNNKFAGANHSLSVEEQSGATKNMVIDNYCGAANGTPATGSLYAGNKTATTSAGFPVETGLWLGDGTGSGLTFGASAQNTTRDVQLFRSASGVLATGTSTVLSLGNYLTLAATNGTGYIEAREQISAPAATADRARIYAEDNGGGKTRLMVRFGTGAAQQIAIEP
jgi:hypothetical protein